MVIGLTGKMGAGKSTAVEVLKFLWPNEINVLKMAQPLYDMQEFIYRRISTAHSRPDNFIKDRKLLQFLGTEWGRDSIRENLWVDLWKVEAHWALEKGKMVVCDDIRFDNEAAAVKNLGGVIVQILSPNSDKRTTSPCGFVDHPSENGISFDLVDHLVVNDSTKDVYMESLIKLFRNIFVTTNGTK